jgi:hypothetical protein
MVGRAEAFAVCRDNPGDHAVVTMRTWAAMGVRETRPNRGRWVDPIISLAGGDPGDAPAWCAYAVWAAWHHAAMALGLRLVSTTSGSVAQSWLAQAGTPAQIHVDAVRSGAIKLQPGDIYCRARDAADVAKVHGGRRVLGHAELVVRDCGDGWLHTAGGNTDGSDNRDGDGVYDKPRGIRLDDPRLIGFVRPVTAILLETK